MKVQLLALSFLMGAPVFGQYSDTDQTFRDYLDAVYDSTVTSHGDTYSRDQWYEVGTNARDAYHDHMRYDNRYGRRISDADLTHFLNEHYRFRQGERRFPTSGNGWARNRYRHRHSHISGCHVCARFTRRFLQYTSLSVMHFSPAYTYFERRRYNVRNSSFLYRGQSCAIRFDYNRYYWYFDYRGRSHRLTWQ